MPRLKISPEQKKNLPQKIPRLLPKKRKISRKLLNRNASRKKKRKRRKRISLFVRRIKLPYKAKILLPRKMFPQLLR